MGDYIIPIVAILVAVISILLANRDTTGLFFL